MDWSKIKEIVIPEGKVKKIVAAGKVIWQKVIAYVNLLPFAIDTTGSVYNNGFGYKFNTRLNSSAKEVALAGYGTCGYIPAKARDVIRVKGVRWDSTVQSGGYFWIFDSKFNKLKAERPSEGGTADITTSVDENGILTATLVSYNTDVAYFRLSAWSLGPSTIITVNEQIPENSANYTNRILTSINADGSIYNGVGYKNGFRVRSDGEETEVDSAACTGFIPVKAGDVIRLCGWNFPDSANDNAINVADSSFTNIGQFTMLPAAYGIFNGAYSAYGSSSVVEEKPGLWKWIVPPAASGVAYIRVSAMEYYGGHGTRMIVTVNEPIYSRLPSEYQEVEYIEFSGYEGCRYKETISNNTE